MPRKRSPEVTSCSAFPLNFFLSLCFFLSLIPLFFLLFLPSVFFHYSFLAHPGSWERESNFLNARTPWDFRGTLLVLHELDESLVMSYDWLRFLFYICRIYSTDHANLWDPIGHYIRHLAVHVRWITPVNHFRTGNERSRIRLRLYISHLDTVCLILK